MISINDFVKQTTDISIKLPGDAVLNLTVNLNRITPAERLKCFGDDNGDLLEQIRTFLLSLIAGWDLQLNADDNEPVPITMETLSLLPDRCCVIIYEKIMEASRQLTGELLH